MNKIFGKYYLLLWVLGCLFSYKQIIAVTNNNESRPYTAFIYMKNNTLGNLILNTGDKLSPSDSQFIGGFYNRYPSDNSYITSNFVEIFLQAQINHLSMSSSYIGNIASGQLRFRLRTNNQVEIDKTQFKITDSLYYRIDGLIINIPHSFDVSNRILEINITVSHANKS